MTTVTVIDSLTDLREIGLKATMIGADLSLFPDAVHSVPSGGNSRSHEQSHVKKVARDEGSEFVCAGRHQMCKGSMFCARLELSYYKIRFFHYGFDALMITPDFMMVFYYSILTG
jgi:hypothetical protein